MKTAAVILVAGLAAVAAQARVITVDDDGPADFNNIQAAIDDANDGDTVIVAEGVYFENLCFGGKNIVLTSTAPKDQGVVTSTVVDGGGNGSVVAFTGTETPDCRLEGLTITGGRAGPYPTGHGAGIQGNGTLATIRRCVITANVAGGAGGGISRCDGLIERCVIRGNRAAGGGGLYLCRGLIRGCHITGNTADGVGAGWDCREFESCLIAGNRSLDQDATLGAALLIRDTGASITNCTIAGNYQLAVSCVFPGAVRVRSSILRDNTFGDIYVAGGTKHAGLADVRYSVLQSDWTQWYGITGSIAADPCFADPGRWRNAADLNVVVDAWHEDAVWVDGDYHLKSQAGRWDAGAGAWVYDDVTSVGIDFGDPLAPVGLESFPNGGRINAGAYGGTAEASRSWFGGPVCETIMAGDINGDCKVDFRDFWFVALNWLRQEGP